MNTKLGTEAKNNLEKDFFNSLVKIMENVRKHRDINLLFPDTFNLRRAGAAIFVGIIKILIIFFITIYQDSRKIKINRNYVSKYNLYLYFLI